MPVSIKTIAAELNKASKNYRIGNIQKIRKEILGFDRSHVKSIFNKNSINGYYTFHDGGRKELQFNIGYEEEMFRYGIAFSFVIDRTLTDSRILIPQVERLNSIIKNEAFRFDDYKMHKYCNDSGQWEESSPVSEITEDDIKKKKFVFIGKYQDKYNGPDEVLKVFDDLFDIYIEVINQKNVSVSSYTKKEEIDFAFDSKRKRKLPEKRNLKVTSYEYLNLRVRHSYLQCKLIEKLEKKYGKENISVENYVGNYRIDMVVKDKDSFYFYEIKTANTPRKCVIEAIG
ncbi:MAG: hypothetical protein SPJ89_06435 [Treponema sp.]|nr:hypothetical protein [Spirochaetia bacterium]MDD7459212.1 hypothetical protein [Spirochaetales bacterium]MDY5811598.1 hypothetical protein [Treponema sp.]